MDVDELFQQFDDADVLEAIAEALIHGGTQRLLPQTDDELWEYIAREYGYEIPRVDVCEGHRAPFSWMADSYFYRITNSILVGPRAGGKGSPLFTPVATPTGWRRIGDLCVGDEVIGSDGRPTLVTGIYDRGVLPVFRVGFSDGSSLLCDGDHLWPVYTRKRWRIGSPCLILSTHALIERGFNDRDQALIIPMVAPVAYAERRLPIDPYAMGCLLANGYLDGAPFIALHEADTDIAQRLEGVLGIKRRGDHDTGYGTGPRLGVSRVRDTLRALGLYGTRSATKFIPQDYLLGSIEQRLALLQGLMDCDGCSDTRAARYSTTSERLALGVRDLAESLGGTGKIKGRSRGDYTEYRVNVNLPPPLRPFWSQRKAGAYDVRYTSKTTLGPVRRIASITLSGQEETRCISVAALDGLYVADRYIVTHNTLGMAILDHLFMDHFGLTLCNVGAIEAQAKKCYTYIDRFVNLPQFREALLKPSLMSKTYLKNGGFVEVLAGTVNQVNSPHSARLHIDECELADPRVIEEAKSIPIREKGCDGRDYPPATVYTSSRKLPYGPLETLLTEAKETGNKVYRYCAFEIIEQCPETRHQNGEGCKVCPLHDICKEKERAPDGTESFKPGPGRAARARGWLLIDDLIDKFKTLDPLVFSSQWLANRPVTAGLAFPMFEEDIHVIDWEWNPAYPTVCGLDFGYVHPNVAMYAQLLENDEVVLFGEDSKSYRTDPAFAESVKHEPWFTRTRWRVGDSAARSSRETLIAFGVANDPAAKEGTDEEPSSIRAGIDLMRYLFAPPGRGRPLLFVARGCKQFIRQAKNYHYPTDNPNLDMNVKKEAPVKKDDDSIDAGRYLLMRLFRHAIVV